MISLLKTFFTEPEKFKQIQLNDDEVNIFVFLLTYFEPVMMSNMNKKDIRTTIVQMSFYMRKFNYDTIPKWAYKLISH